MWKGINSENWPVVQKNILREPNTPHPCETFGYQRFSKFQGNNTVLEFFCQAFSTTAYLSLTKVNSVSFLPSFHCFLFFIWLMCTEVKQHHKLTSRSSAWRSPWKLSRSLQSSSMCREKLPQTQNIYPMETQLCFTTAGTDLRQLPQQHITTQLQYSSSDDKATKSQQVLMCISALSHTALGSLQN